MMHNNLQKNGSKIREGSYPFQKKKNCEEFFKTLIDFSRTPVFTLNSFISKILQSILHTVYLHFS